MLKHHKIAHSYAILLSSGESSSEILIQSMGIKERLNSTELQQEFSENVSMYLVAYKLIHSAWLLHFMLDLLSENRKF